MPDTIPDVQLQNDAYEDVYTLTGITLNADVVIQNKSNTKVRIQEAAAQPAVDSKDGYLLEPDPRHRIKIINNTSKIWVKGAGCISVQED